MKVVYTAPNRAHHYNYALALYNAGILNSFVSGFSRYSPRAKLPELGNQIHRADLIQTFYLGLLKLRLPEKIASQFAYYAKLEQDLACKKYLNKSDIFLFYNGSGLNSCRLANKKGIITIVEVVNTHVDYQENILRHEYEKLGIPFLPFHKKEKARRIEEYNEADYIMVPSEFVMKSFLEYGFPENKLLKVPYGFNKFSREINSTSTGENESFTILFVGSISVRKGLRYLIKAFEKLRHPLKKLVIVGPATNDSGLNNLLIPKGVIFTGSLKGNDLNNAYKSADVFCLPSIEDGFGLVIGEAISYGIPVIATTNTGAVDILTDGKDGFIVNVADELAIYDKLQLLADDKLSLLNMKNAASIKSTLLDGWDKTANILIETMKSVYKNKYAK